MVPGLRALRIVEVVAAHGSLTAAAGALHLSVSALSRALQAVEATLHTPVLERGPRGMAPTPVARVLVQAAERAHCHLSDLVHRSQPSVLPAAEAQRRAAVALARIDDAMLAALVAVADSGSESRAAQQLGVSQPAVHQRLRALEQLLRAPLIRRAGTGTRLTETGERILRSARLVLHELRLGGDDLAHLLGRGERRVTVGVLPMASTVLLPAALDRVWRADAQLLVTVVDGTYDALLEQLRNGDIDLLVGPLRGAGAVPDVEEEQLFEETLVVVVGRTHMLAGPREALALADLVLKPWIAPLPDTPARTGFDRMFTAAGLAIPTPSVQANSPAVLRRLLAQGRHLALVSPLQVHEELRAGELVQLLTGPSGASRTIGVTRRRQGRLPTGGASLLDNLRQVALGMY